MLKGFANKVAVVTGAASGLGLALSKILVNSGAHVMLIDNNQESLDFVMQEFGSKATGVVADVANFECIAKVIQDMQALHGRLDYLFNNAATTILGEVRDISIKDWNTVLSVNLNGSVHGIAAAYPIMVKQKFGHIVNISSLSGITPAVMLIPYTTSKFGIVGLSHSLRMEAKQWGVNVSVACPNLLNTPIWTTSKVVGSLAQRPKDFLSLFTPTPKLTCVDKAALIILSGVLKNKATIISDFYSRAIWWGYRMCPALWMWIYNLAVTKKFRTLRK